jgi:hypothetical protein
MTDSAPGQAADVQKLTAGRLSGGMFALAFMTVVAGFATSAFRAPCSEAGAWVTVGGLAVSLIAWILLLIRTLKNRSSWDWAILVAAGLGIAFAVFSSYVWTLLLCRGI